MIAPAVTLSSDEVRRAVLVGGCRQWHSIQQKLKDKVGLSRDDGWTLHIEGAAAECAACKCLGVPWLATIDDLEKRADIPPDIEVRRRIEMHYDLCIRKGDRPEMKFLLVLGRIPSFLVRGWIYGRDGMQPRYWHDPNGRGAAWFVPQSELRPISELMPAVTMPEQRELFK